MIEIVEAKNKKQMLLFAKFPIKLYRKCPYYVPNFINDEKNILNPKINLNYADNKAICFLAYKDKKLVGRICGIISPSANKKDNKKEVRFSRPDFIKDIEVLKALLNAVAKWGKENGMDTICGPWGFNDTDREGLLTYGYDELSNYATMYSFPYYAQFFNKLGFEKQSEWVEYEIDYNHINPVINRVATQIRKSGKYHDIVESNMSVKKIVNKYRDSFFECYNRSYANLDNFVPFTGDNQDQVLKNFATIINRNYFSVILDENDTVVAFGVGIPHIGKTLHKGRGNMLLSIIPLMYTLYFPRRIELVLIGVLPEYEKQGLNALVAERFLKNFKKHKIKSVWTTPMLTTNTKILNTFGNAERILRQKRQTYVMPLSKCLKITSFK